MSKQILRSATSIGANIAEAEFAQSKADFISKFSISLKETAETLYWLDLLQESHYIQKEKFIILHDHCLSILKLLIASINTIKKSL